jgi:hypothetical protein
LTTSTFAIVFFFFRQRLRLLAFDLVSRSGRSAVARRGYLRLPPAFFDAFNGSTVKEPANPRRSRGGCLAFEINT